MSDNVDLYNTSYGNFELEVYRRINSETYGEDIGQTGWATTKEFKKISQLLALTAKSNALDLGCGAGGCAIYFAEITGCFVTGIDVNASGINSANELTKARDFGAKVHFEQMDANEQLSFEEDTFDAVYSNDAMCHIRNRPIVLREIHRVLKPGGKLAFSDALVVDGLLSSEEIVARTSIGHYVLPPRGENEHLIAEAGFNLLAVDDTTADAAAIAKHWHDARERRREALIAIESETNFSGLQHFLDIAYTLMNEKRLSRYLYFAQK